MGRDLRTVMIVTILSFLFNAVVVAIINTLVDAWYWFSVSIAFDFADILYAALVQGLVSFCICSFSTSANLIFAERTRVQAYMVGVVLVSLMAVLFSWLVHAGLGNQKTLIPLIWALGMNLFLSFVIVSGRRDALSTIKLIPKWTPRGFQLMSRRFIRRL